MNLWRLRFSKNRSRMRGEALKKWARVPENAFVLDLGGGINPFNENSTVVDIQKGLDFDEYETNEKFDSVACVDAIYYSKNPLALLKKAKAWLKPNGRLLIGIFSPEWYNRVVLDIKTPAFYLWDEKVMTYLLEEAGFEVVKTTRFKLQLLSLPLFFPSWTRFGKRIFFEAKPR